MNLPPQDDLLGDEARIFGLFAEVNTSLDLDGQLLLARLNEQLFQAPRDNAIRIGRYHVDRLLGEGGMGRVYLAHDPKTGGPLAVKVLRFSGLSSELRVRAQRVLRREARLMANLRAHPNIVVVYDIDETDDQVVVAMQYIEGGDLRAWQHRRRDRWREVLDMYLTVARGLAHAHLNRIVHGDFKPDNVLVDLRDQPHITDFGLARSLEIAEGEELDHGESIGAAGTPEYMAPEQFNHQQSDQASDQFSFCVALFEALLGAHPYARTTYGELAETLRSKGRDVSEELVRARYVTDLVKTMHHGELRWPRATSRLPRWLRAVLARGLHVSPGQRFASMTELLAEVDRATRRTRHVRLGLGLFGLIAISTLGGVVVARPSHDSKCEEAGEAIKKIWNDDERARVTAKFGAEAVPILGAANRYASAWSSTATEICQQTNDIGDQSAVLKDTRRACLDASSQEFAALCEQIHRFPNAEGALRYLNTLAAPEGCADATSAYPLPQDDARRSALKRYRESSAEAFRDELVEKYLDAMRESDDAVQSAIASGYPPAVVGAYFFRGRINIRASLYEATLDDRESARARGESDLKTAHLLGIRADPQRAVEAYVFLQRLLAREGRGDAAALGDVAHLMEAGVRDGSSARLGLDRLSHQVGLTLERRASYLEVSAIFHVRRILMGDDPALDVSATRRSGFDRAVRDYDAALAANQALASLPAVPDDPQARQGLSSDRARLLQNAADAAALAASEYINIGKTGDDLTEADRLLVKAEQEYAETQTLWRSLAGPDAPVLTELRLALADLDETRWRAASRRAAEGHGSVADVDAAYQAFGRRLEEEARLGDTTTALRLRQARFAIASDLAQAEKLATIVTNDKNLTESERCAALETSVTARFHRQRLTPGNFPPSALSKDVDMLAAVCTGAAYTPLIASFRARLQLLAGDPAAAKATLETALIPERLSPDAKFYASLDLAQAELERARHDPAADRTAFTTALQRAEAALQRARHELPAQVGFAWATARLADLNRAYRELRGGAQ